MKATKKTATKKTVDYNAVLKTGLNTLTEHLPAIGGGVLCVGLGMWLINLVVGSVVGDGLVGVLVGSGATLVLQTYLRMGLMALCTAAARKRSTGLDALFSISPQVWGRGVIVSALFSAGFALTLAPVFLVGGLKGLLLVIPALVVALMLWAPVSQTMYLLVDAELDVFSAFSASLAMTQGHRRTVLRIYLTCFGLFLVAALGGALVPVGLRVGYMLLVSLALYAFAEIAPAALYVQLERQDATAPSPKLEVRGAMRARRAA